MLNKEGQKLFFYEVDPLFFKDSSNDGYGDFKGFLSKTDYFKFLDVDGIIFPDIFNQEKNIAKPVDMSIFDKYGKLSELLEIITKLEKEKINFMIEIDVKNILSSMLLKDRDEHKTTEMLIKSSNDDTTLNWATKKTINSFKKIIQFWTKNKVHNFVITNFESLYEKNAYDQLIVQQLKELYKIVKSINSRAIIILKSTIYSPEIINDLFKNHMGEAFDLFIDNSYPFLCTNKQNPYDILEKFNPKQIFKKLSKISISNVDQWRYIVNINNNQIGRVLSRWMNENVLSKESTKTLLTMLHFLPFSTINTYGDELGALRSKITNNSQYYDFSYNERKRKLEESIRYKVDYFHRSQQYLSKIQSQLIFLWDSTDNAGFSASFDNEFRKKSINFMQANVKTQYYENNSNLRFYRDIIKKIKSPLFKNFFQTNDKNQINFLKRKILQYKFISNNETLVVLINLNNQFIKYKKMANVIVSTYSNKTYTNNTILGLAPYESIVFIEK